MLLFGDRCWEESSRAVLQEPVLTQERRRKNLIQIETQPSCARPRLSGKLTISVSKIQFWYTPLWLDVIGWDKTAPFRENRGLGVESACRSKTLFQGQFSNVWALNVTRRKTFNVQLSTANKWRVSRPPRLSTLLS